MISWIKGDLITSWQTNNKFFILINSHGLGYEIQILESIFNKLNKKEISNKNIILWLKHIKKEDSDSLFGFISKEQKDFFIEILSIKGIGSQIGMSLLNKFSINEIINAINRKDKKLISSVQGIGNKMAERLFLELKSNIISESKIQEESTNFESYIDDSDIKSILNDLHLTLQSLNYSKKEIKKIFPVLIKDIKYRNKFPKEEGSITFERLLKEAMNYLAKTDSNLDQ